MTHQESSLSDSTPQQSSPGSEVVNRSVFDVPKMDCPAEEQMIRMAVRDIKNISGLAFDLGARKLTVWHFFDAGEIVDRLVETGLGARLVETTEEADLEALKRLRPISDREEAKVLWVLLSINAFMFLLEIVTGWMAQSTGLIADSLDMFADAGVYGLSLYAVGRAASLKVKAAHLSGWLQLTLAVGALVEVLRRFVFGSDPEPSLMIGIAAVALAANVTCLVLLARHRKGGAHMRASWIFSTNDVIANFGVIVAGVLVGLTGSRFPDLIVGSIIGAIVFSGAIRILRLR